MEANAISMYFEGGPFDEGTVVSISNMVSTALLTDNAKFGVVVEASAIILNYDQNSLGTLVAISGRVPIKCTGSVTPGDKLELAGPGVVKSANIANLDYSKIVGTAVDSDSGGVVMALLH